MTSAKVEISLHFFWRCKLKLTCVGPGYCYSKAARGNACDRPRLHLCVALESCRVSGFIDAALCQSCRHWRPHVAAPIGQDPLVPSGHAARIYPSVSRNSSVLSVSPINLHDYPVSLHISFTCIYLASFCFYRVDAIVWSIVLDTIYPWLEIASAIPAHMRYSKKILRLV
jgi:hypothetical protein